MAVEGGPGLIYPGVSRSRCRRKPATSDAITTVVKMAPKSPSKRTTARASGAADAWATVEGDKPEREAELQEQDDAESRLHGYFCSLISFSATGEMP